MKPSQDKTLLTYKGKKIALSLLACWKERLILHRDKKLNTFASIMNELYFQLTLEQNTTFAVLYLDSIQSRFLAFEKVFKEINDIESYVEDSVNRAVLHRANTVILARNTLKGEVKPTDQDKKLYYALQGALEKHAIFAVDYFIVSAEKHFSFIQEQMRREKSI